MELNKLNLSSLVSKFVTNDYKRQVVKKERKECHPMRKENLLENFL
jgi:hypothetical protein